LIQMVGDPDLDDGLSCDTQPFGLAVECVDHPGGKVDVDPALLVPGVPRLGQVEAAGDGLPSVGSCVELFSLHRSPPPPFVPAPPRAQSRPWASVPAGIGVILVTRVGFSIRSAMSALRVATACPAPWASSSSTVVHFSSMVMVSSAA